MSQTASSVFTFDVEAIDSSIRQTNVLLRFANALRLSVTDIQKTWDEPTIANVMWTLIQIVRTYTALRRLMRTIAKKTNTLTKTAGLLRPLPIIGPAQEPRVMIRSFTEAFGRFAVNIDANINGVPVPIDAVDISDIRNKTLNQLQEIIESETPRIAEEARRILRSRILRPDLSTGRLESSIGWIPRLPGAEVFASAPYSFWVEEGQRSFTGHHFLRDATARGRQRINERVRAEINELISSRHR